MNININDITLENALGIIKDQADAIIAVNTDEDSYHTILRRGLFTDFIEENGVYKELIEKLWYHFNNSDKRITEDYHVFIPSDEESSAAAAIRTGFPMRYCRVRTTTFFTVGYSRY